MTGLFARDFRLSIAAGGGAFVALLFFLAIVAIIPFGLGPDLNLLGEIGPAILWIGALLSGLLGLDRLFALDREDGSLDLFLMASGRQPVVLTVFIKCLAHFAGIVLPLVLAAPLLGLLLNMTSYSIGVTLLTLLVGAPAISFVGAVGAAVTVTLPRGGLLVAILVLPLLIPVLIFGVSAANGAVRDPDPFLAPFLILAALTLFFAVLGPVAAAYALMVETHPVTENADPYERDGWFQQTEMTDQMR
ncbi:heme exporter protein CcmB [Notoacmeibacter ruber]|uniref:Heme exporter protein B n=1 Tax=Notoacmeibacter ruber TaxID=2670375 RepID=A0A3L7JF66_9HYPH|nr:heme exporter protein CcmB [Notoacmeibacter ruber]